MYAYVTKCTCTYVTKCTCTYVCICDQVYMYVCDQVYMYVTLTLLCAENRKKSSEVGLNEVLKQKDEQIAGLMEEGLVG